MIRIKDIHKTYVSKAFSTDVLRGISLDIEEGEFVSVTGKSGCGKTTLLNILGLMEKSSRGDYFFDDININELKKNDESEFRCKKIGYIFQSFNLISEMSILENVCVPMGYAGVSPKARKKRAEELLESVGLKNRLNFYPKQLSGGQCQRAAIARSLANNPRVLLADEPTGNLDEKNSSEVMEILSDLNKRGTTIIMVTHDISLASKTHHTIVISDGTVV